MTPACYVLHVKKGYEDREKSIIQQFSALNLPFEWVLDHDKDEITPQTLEDFHYRGNFNMALRPQTSYGLEARRPRPGTRSPDL